jgi:hypothetical protein
MKLSKSSAAADHKPGCPSYRMVKGWRSNRGYMFAMMLAMLALMAVMGVGLSRLMITTKATTQMQRSQDNKQLMSNLVMTLSSKAADSDGDFVLEPPAYSTETITGFAAPTNGGFVGTDVVNVDAWGRRLGYCAYDYGSATATPPSGTGLIRGSTNSSPTDSWVAVVVISAGPDGVITTPCPAADTLASDVAATGDDMVAARSYGEMVSFGNAQIASTLSGLIVNSQNKLCRLDDGEKMVCDVAVDTCAAYQLSKWNATSFKFDCVNFKPADCAGGRQHSETWSTSCPSGQTGTINYQCLNGVTSQTGSTCATPPTPPNLCNVVNFPINVIQQTDTPQNKWWENTVSVSLPVDATDIQLRIIRFTSDDNSGKLWINGALIFDFDSEPDNMEAHFFDMNYDLSGAINAGSNSIKGRVLDYYGVFATLRIRISGTYKTQQTCNISVN